MGSRAWKVPDYGNVAPVVVDERTDAERATLRVRQALLARDHAPPPLPPVTLALIELARRPDVPFREALALIEQEPVLAARVLDVAQSSLYAGGWGRRHDGPGVDGRPPRTLELALTRLGLSTLSHVFLQVVITARVFEAAPRYAAPMEALRKHSVLVGHATRLICRASGLDAEHAFLCGLLHDVGFALGAIEASADATTTPPYELVAHALATTHEGVAAAAARTWKLPAEVATVLAHHHDPIGEGRIHPVAAAVQLADAWVTELGFGTPGERSFVSFTTVPALDLGPRDLARIRASVELYAERLARV